MSSMKKAKGGATDPADEKEPMKGKTIPFQASTAKVVKEAEANEKKRGGKVGRKKKAAGGATKNTGGAVAKATGGATKATGGAVAKATGGAVAARANGGSVVAKKRGGSVQGMHGAKGKGHAGRRARGGIIPKGSNFSMAHAETNAKGEKSAPTNDSDD